MTSYDRVVWVLIAESILIVLALLAVFWHAFSLRSALARRVPMLERGRALLYHGLQEGAVDDAAGEELCRFPRGTQVRLFAELAPNLVGDDREWLARVAERCGLLTYARRRATSSLWWRRLNAARLLTMFARSEDTMFTLAKDSYPLVRAQAAEAFGLIPSDRGIDTLIALLADRHPLVRFMARDSLVRLGRPAHAAIAAHIGRHDDPSLLPLLGIAATSPSHDFATAVGALVTDPRVEIRAAVADVLRSVGGADASAQLATMLDDPDIEVRRRAVDGLASLGFWPAASAIARLIDDPDWQVRYRAAIALQNLGGPGELLLRRASERDTIGTPIVRRVLDAAAQLRLEAATR